MTQSKTESPPVEASPIAVDEYAAAGLLGVSVHFLRKDRITKRRIPFFRLGDRILYMPNRMAEAVTTLEEGGAPLRGKKTKVTT
jgi:hypothetical protein